jgi:cyclohexa-1,5-dienecarbonyl-CoA hydratase
MRSILTSLPRKVSLLSVVHDVQNREFTGNVKLPSNNMFGHANPRSDLCDCDDFGIDRACVSSTRLGGLIATSSMESLLRLALPIGTARFRAPSQGCVISVTENPPRWRIVAGTVGRGDVRLDLRRARLELSCNGQVATLVLAAPKANILDRKMMRDLDCIFRGLKSNQNLKAIILAAEGPSFSYGASVREHLPEEIELTLNQLRGLLIAVAKAPAPTIAAVRGHCLGGGFELALACDLIAAEETAQFGCPEIKLGVFPPAASALLPARAGAGWASNIVLTGNTYSGKDLFAAGVVSRLAAAGELDGELERWLESDFLPRSAAALRHAATAARLTVLRALEQDLPLLERIYLDKLMREPDALEGIRAFLEKREPQWSAPGSAAGEIPSQQH